jgi:hypothetical protein
MRINIQNIQSYFSSYTKLSNRQYVYRLISLTFDINKTNMFNTNQLINNGRLLYISKRFLRNIVLKNKNQKRVRGNLSKQLVYKI